jgi:LacI family transcriptional regulator
VIRIGLNYLRHRKNNLREAAVCAVGFLSRIISDTADDYQTLYNERFLPMSTLKQVAKEAHVSVGTVSNVIRGTAHVSPELRERVLTAIRELEYYPGAIASDLVKQTYMLGMVLPDITNPFFPEMMRGAGDRAYERGYLLVTADTDERIEREKKIVSALRSRRVDGILLAAAPGKDTRHVRAAMQAGISVVCIDRSASGIDTDAVLLDNAGGAQRCVRHLIRAGYHRIAIITGPLCVQSARERFHGYRDALEEAEIKIAHNLVQEGDYRKESGYKLGRKLAKMRDRPSAIFVCNGMMTLGVLEALEEVGIQCPQDIALATFDHPAESSSFHPRLTTVVQPGYEIGSRAATILMDRVEGRLKGAYLTVRISPTLTVGESTASAQKNGNLRSTNAGTSNCLNTFNDRPEV